MYKLLFSAVLIACLLVLEVSCNDNMLSPPERPETFRNPAELRRYLQALHEYYSIVGRPRFGRSANKRSLEEFAEVKNDDEARWVGTLFADW
ncbi:hypothetical protein C0Q70_02807 [Pomacea canaliculata]|uniref:Neuropeptide Y n=1 Tax=Pomacea canaliculata TaxID=400727 RepID=A0A2T7PQZ8_POMCA|nr:hypothetical protein C0Q70_02807 [Pomacea canaliculata]